MERSDLRKGNIDTFSLFKKALMELCESDTYLFAKKAKRESFSCRMAQHLNKYFGAEWYIDAAIDGSDLLIWDRQGNMALALFISRDYVSALQKEKARLFHSSNAPSLTLALSLIEKKDYMLIYRFEDEYIEYLHIYPDQDYRDTLLKRCLIKDDIDTSPELFRTKKRKKDDSTSSQDQ